MPVPFFGAVEKGVSEYKDAMTQRKWVLFVFYNLILFIVLISVFLGIAVEWKNFFGKDIKYTAYSNVQVISFNPVNPNYEINLDNVGTLSFFPSPSSVGKSGSITLELATPQTESHHPYQKNGSSTIFFTASSTKSFSFFELVKFDSHGNIIKTGKSITTYGNNPQYTFDYSGNNSQIVSVGGRNFLVTLLSINKVSYIEYKFGILEK